MFKFITGRKGYTLERAKIVKELFAFSRTVSHGFPHGPSALAFDEVLSLMCICTKNATVRVYGGPGVEFVGYHPQESPVVQVHFIQGQGRLITLQENNEFSLWEINDTQLELVETINNFEKRIFSICVTPNKKQLLLGTKQGDIYVLDLETFKFTDLVVQRDLITEKVPEDFKVSPGGVECLKCLNQDQCIVGYQRGILVLFDLNKLSAKQTYISRKDLSSVYVVDDSKFVSCHTDGGYAVWSTILSSSTKQVDQVYGPHACKAVDKLYAFDNERTLIFSGGMPRSQYGDRYTLSVHRGPIERKVFEFTSKVIDFFIVSKKVIVVLAEEEVLAISLQDLKPIPLPYLFSLHCSAITNVIHAPAVSREIVDQLTDSNSLVDYSNTKWPIQGGKLDTIDEADDGKLDLIVTGHEDGSVRIYNATGVVLKLLTCIKTSLVFSERCQDASRLDQDDDEFLQFTKVGSFDPYSDDPRFAVKRLAFNSDTGTIVVGGTAGQVLVLSLKEKSELQVVQLNLVGDRDNFVWKGHEPLNFDSQSDLNSSYSVRNVIQISPPAGLTSVAITEKWNLVAAGTAHGFGCVDLNNNQVIMFKCTLNETDLGGAGVHSGDMVRRKSFKKSLRESFRRLRKGRSQRGKTAKNLDEVKPVERQVESRLVQDDGLSSMVRSLVFSDAYILSHSTTSRTFWASTNSGAVYAYALKKTEDTLAMSLCKEIHLKHHAPVMGIFIVDSHGFLCHDGPPPESPTPNLWRVVICSEEQIKVFSLPQLKPLHKVKLTANEGSRIRKLQVAEFKNSERAEFGLITLTNQGQVIAYSLPELRRILTADCCRKDDVNGISSAVFTPHGEGFYLNSASEFDRVSVSATKVTAPYGVLELAESARPLRKTTEACSSEKEVKEQRKSVEKTPEKKEKTADKKEKTPEKKEKTPEKADKKEKTPEKAEKKENTPEKAEKKEKSPEKVEKKAKSPEKTEKREKSPEKSQREKSPEKKDKTSPAKKDDKTQEKKADKKEKTPDKKGTKTKRSPSITSSTSEKKQDSAETNSKKSVSGNIQEAAIDVKEVSIDKEVEKKKKDKKGTSEQVNEAAVDVEIRSEVESTAPVVVAAEEKKKTNGQETAEPPKQEVEVERKTEKPKATPKKPEPPKEAPKGRNNNKNKRRNSKKNAANAAAAAIAATNGKKKKDNNSNNVSEENGKETTVNTKESHERKEQKSRSHEKSEDGTAEKTVEMAKSAERKIKQQVEEGDGFKVETTEVVVTKKALVVSEETRVINGAHAAETMERLEALTKSLQIDDMLSKNGTD